MKNTMFILVFCMLLLFGCGQKDGSTADSSDDISDSDALSEGGQDPEEEGSDSPDPDSGSIEPSKSSDLLQNCLGFTDQKSMVTCSAALNKDMKMCDQIVDQYGRDLDERYQEALCKVQVAIMKKDVSICSSDAMNVAGFGVVDCFESYALATKQKSICDKYTDANSVTGCKKRYAAAHEDISLSDCESIGMECYVTLTIKTKDTKVCDAWADDSPDLFKETNRIICNAMIKKDESMCTQLKSAGVDNWWFCERMVLAQLAAPGNGQFYPEKCGDNWDCQEMLVAEIVKYAASG